MPYFDFLNQDETARRRKLTGDERVLTGQDPGTPQPAPRQIPQHLQPHAQRKATAAQAIVAAFDEYLGREASNRQKPPAGYSGFVQGGKQPLVGQLENVRGEVVKNPVEAARLLERLTQDAPTLVKMEALVKAYRDALESPEEKEYSQFTAVEELPTRRASAAAAEKIIGDLTKKRDALLDEEKRAVSEREMAEIQQRLQQLDAQIADAKGHSAVVGAKAAEVAGIAQPQPAQGAQVAPAGPPLSVDDILSEGGMTRDEFMSRLAKYAEEMKKQGYPADRQIRPDRFAHVLTGMLVGMGPVGQQIAMAMTGADMAQRAAKAPPKKGEGAKKEEPSPEMAMIDQQQQELKKREQDIYKQLAATGGFRSVLDVLSYVLLAMTFGPKMAAKHLIDLQASGADNLRRELDRIGDDLRALQGQQLNQMRTETSARQQAALAMSREGRLERAQEFDNYVAMQRLAMSQQSKTGERDKTLDDLMKAYGALARGIDQRQNIIDSYAFDADPGVKDEAKQELAALKQRAATIMDYVEAYTRSLHEGKFEAPAGGP